MADFNPKTPALIVLAVLAAPGIHAAAPAKQQTIVLDAQSFDYTVDNMVFHKVKITQGDMSISADQGQGTRQGEGSRPSANVDFDNSLWVFHGNVKITMDQGQVGSDEAQITFYRQQLSKAVATGNPAVFEDRVEKTGKLAHGHADTIDYDAGKGIVTLLNNAWLNDGQSEIRGDSVKYNLVARSIVAEGTEPDSQRVHIVITPPPSKP
ncbi:MAG: lipopolysaccharide transport periplasmic protein LptA [Steroidobacteraceae bacterium]|jgi:lipopolysaccharide transport protein LptA